MAHPRVPLQHAGGNKRKELGDKTMTEILVLAVFTVSLFLCIFLDVSILIALAAGFFLFFLYGLCKHHTVKEMISFAWSGVRKVKNILITFILIGIITAVWRACGTIPYIVYHATKFCTPNAMVLMTFLLCCVISVLTGTSLGTAATMGVICAAISGSMGVPAVYTGGAVLAGAYFGDRCSPMSTSALLVSTVTGTDLFRNIRGMIRTSVVPLLIACAVYAVLGMGIRSEFETVGIREQFAEHFVLHPATLIPAVVIIVFSLFKINVRITMTVSILCGAAAAVWIQNIAPGNLLELAVLGYHPEDPELRGILSGGGIVSMVQVFCNVCISSSYSGMFNGTGLLDGVRKGMEKLSRKVMPFGCVVITSILTSLIACNQTLAVMLTQQLCEETEPDAERMAVYLENSAVVIPPLIPWSIACAVPLATVGAPDRSVLLACYLYLLPVWNYLVLLIRKRKASKKAGVAG